MENDLTLAGRVQLSWKSPPVRDLSLETEADIRNRACPTGDED